MKTYIKLLHIVWLETITYVVLNPIRLYYTRINIRFMDVDLTWPSPPLSYMVRSSPVRSSKREEVAAVLPVVVDVSRGRKSATGSLQQTSTKIFNVFL